ncbi:MAG: efflux transporter periplasmic adaptor subunit, partial [Polaromonas sp.]|nr:efflux transporter periplasmic adaptor subunit [Polaromonas sp.]
VVATGQQRVQRDGTVVSVVDLSANASSRAGNGNGKTAAAASPASQASSAAAVPAAPQAAAPKTAVAATAPAPQQAPLAGPNPCGVVVSEAPGALIPVRSVAPAERSPAVPPARAPA